MTNQRLAVAVVAITMGVFIMAGEIAAQQTSQPSSATSGGGNDDLIKELNAQRDLVKAQTEVIAAQKALVDAMFPQFGDKFGKAGEIKIEQGEGDKFHATARAAEALKGAALRVCTDAVKAAKDQDVALVTDDDRKAIAVYRIMEGDGAALEARMRQASNVPTGPVPEAMGPNLAIYGAGMLLSEIADFAKLFRTDRSLFFSAPDLSEQLLVDLVASCANGKLLYPAASIDSSLANQDTEFLKRVKTLRALREKLIPDKNKELIDRFDQFMTKLLAVDDAKVPTLFHVLRGEAATKAIQRASGRVLTVRLTTKGGTTMKTSNVWRNERFFTSGGVIVSYRYSEVDKVMIADVITMDSGFSELELK